MLFGVDTLSSPSDLALPLLNEPCYKTSAPQSTGAVLKGGGTDLTGSRPAQWSGLR